MLRDLPTERLEPVRGALRRLAEAAAAGEPLLALAAGARAVAAVTPSRVIVAGDEVAGTRRRRAVAGGALLAGGAEALAGLDELEPGRLAAMLELVTAAEPAPRPAERRAPRRRPTRVDLLRKLGDLRDGGVLTDAEFAAKKAELLRRI